MLWLIKRGFTKTADRGTCARNPDLASWRTIGDACTRLPWPNHPGISLDVLAHTDGDVLRDINSRLLPLPQTAQRVLQERFAALYTVQQNVDQDLRSVVVVRIPEAILPPASQLALVGK